MSVLYEEYSSSDFQAIFLIHENFIMNLGFLLTSQYCLLWRSTISEFFRCISTGIRLIVYLWANLTNVKKDWDSWPTLKNPLSNSSDVERLRARTATHLEPSASSQWRHLVSLRFYLVRVSTDSHASLVMWVQQYFICFIRLVTS